MYSFCLFQSTIPSTRIVSFKEFVSNGRKKSIQIYLVEFLKSYPQGLSTRQISHLSGIEIGSLTNPIKSLYDTGKIIRNGVVKNSTGRIAITYALPLSNSNTNQPK